MIEGIGEKSHNNHHHNGGKSKNNRGKGGGEGGPGDDQGGQGGVGQAGRGRATFNGIKPRKPDRASVAKANEDRRMESQRPNGPAEKPGRPGDQDNVLSTVAFDDAVAAAPPEDPGWEVVRTKGKKEKAPGRKKTM